MMWSPSEVCNGSATAPEREISQLRVGPSRRRGAHAPL